MPDNADRPHGNPFVALAIVLVAAFMVLLDISIVNVAIPSIQRDLHTSFAQVQFVIAGYQLAYGVLLITGGRLGDILGRKLMFILGVIGFTVASAICGLAQDGTQLVVARVFQGLMASMMYPQIFSIIAVAFPPQRRAVALGIFGGVIGIATIAGPLVGGLLIEANLFNLDWRPIFLINLPIGVIAVVAAALRLVESKPTNPPKLDPIGVVIATVGLFLLTYPLVEGRDAGWPLWSYVMLAGSVVVMGVFVVFERRREASGKDPLMVSSLFQSRSFVVGMLLFIVFFSGLPSLFLTLSLFLQIGLGFSALHTGLTVIPFATGSGLASGAGIRLVGRMGRNLLSMGAALASLGVLGVIYTIRVVGPDLKGPELIPALFVAGAGLGFVIAPSLNFVLAGVRNADVGSASGVLTTVQQIGGAMGVAVIGVIFFGLLGSNADRVTDRVTPPMRQQIIDLGAPPAAADVITQGFRECFHDRSNESDPTINPPRCVAAQEARPNLLPDLKGQPTMADLQRISQVGQGIGRIALDNLNKARAQNFTDVIQWSLLYNAGAFGFSFLLLFFLPRPERLTPPGGGAPGGH
jgi:EmrB/QacA subfamily drug resistance transporter